MKKIQQIIIAFALVAGIGMAVALPAGNVSAIKVFDANKQTCKDNASNQICKAAKNEGTGAASSLAKKVINTMLYIIGILAAILIVFGGIRYTVSAGDASKVKAAKDTIMYAVIGLIVALMSFVIVNFVLTRL